MFILHLAKEKSYKKTTALRSFFLTKKKKIEKKTKSERSFSSTKKRNSLDINTS